MVDRPEPCRRRQLALCAKFSAIGQSLTCHAPSGERVSAVGCIRATLRAMIEEAPVLEFWFDFASTYSYLTAMRIEGLAESRGVKVRWQPFLLGPIFASVGWTTSPFEIYAEKGRYMWRDLDREAQHAGIPFRKPSTFPRNSTTAARVALHALKFPWGPQFVRAIFRANFVDDRNVGDASVIDEVLAGLGTELDPKQIRLEAESPSERGALRAATGEATKRGIFGAPTFFTGDEMFWGNDRLERALEAATGQRGPLGGTSK